MTEGGGGASDVAPYGAMPLNRPMRILGWAIAVHFVVRCGFLLWWVAPGVGPDEMYHLQSIDSAKVSPYHLAFHVTIDGTLKPDPAAERFGGMVATPPLNSFLFGTIASAFGLDVFEMPVIRLFRALNFLLAVGALLLGARFIGEAFGFGLPVLISGVIITNLFMFADLCVTVTYDNLLLLLSNLGLLHLARLSRRFEWSSVMWCLFGVSGACLTKVSAVPMFAFCGALFLPALWRAFRRRPRAQAAAGAGLAVLSCSAIALCATCVAFYLWNVRRFGSLYPDCTRIFPPQACGSNYYSQYDDICVRLPDSERVGYLRFLANWGYKMVESVLGVKSHLCVMYPVPWVMMTATILGAGLLGFVGMLRRASPTARTSAAAIIPYVILLSYVWNYRSCPRLESPGINGRYIFPMGAPLLGAISAGLLHLAPTRLRATCVALLGLTFVMLSTPIAKVTWFFGSRSQAFYRSLPYYPNPVYDLDFRLLR